MLKQVVKISIDLIETTEKIKYNTYGHKPVLKINRGDNMNELDKNKEYYVIARDANLQVAVLNILEQNGYRWPDGTPATEYVPMKRTKSDILYIYPNERQIAWGRSSYDIDPDKIKLNPHSLTKTVIL